MLLKQPHDFLEVIDLLTSDPDLVVLNSWLDFVVYGGAQTTILLLRKQCPFLARLEGAILPPLLDIPEPRQAVLEKAARRVWSSSVIEWRDDEVLV